MQYQNLGKNRIFAGLSEKEIDESIELMKARVKFYEKSNPIIKEGDEISSFFYIIKGSIFVYKCDILGNRRIISIAKSGQLFAEAFYINEVKFSPVYAVASEDSKLISLTLDKNNFVDRKDLYLKIMTNMCKVLAMKNTILRKKIDILNLPTIRDKVLYYLRSLELENSSKYFFIEYNVSSLSEYLGVNRSALSRELSKMKKEGIIDYYKNQFRILK
ncbi:Crp/Fnr family transcriptional regulator [Peptoniphilus sp. GNH]|nr:Crp/Fnr family transcriptional regulator [Peptoniphilus sp. GNH]